MKIPKQFAAASLVLALASTTGAHAGKNDITLTTPFGDAPALAFSWGASNSSSFPGGGGGGAGKANFQDVSVTRTPDAQSAKFLENVAKGTILTTVTVAKGPMKLILTEVLISSYQTSGADGDKSTENISMKFRKFSYTADGGVPFCFDIAANAAC
jgi:type VI secretion system secreted protein Hcp